MILAGIDIGTNAIRLLIADISATSHRSLCTARTMTRLGKDLDRTGVLSPEARERALAVLHEFSLLIDRYSVQHVVAVGTSALRKAANASAFVREVRERTGFDVSVVSGQEEARLTLLGVRRALSGGEGGTGDPLASALIIDSGGGSTEFIVTREGKVSSDTSLDLGAVYLTERFLKRAPPLPEDLKALRRSVRQDLAMWEAERLHPLGMNAASPAVLVGTAGTITTLAAMAQELPQYDPDRINGYHLTSRSLNGIIEHLSRTSLAERRNMPGLEEGREDIILAGAVIAQEIMEYCAKAEVLVSDWGLREGIVLDLLERRGGALQ
jgi:exopolyphosphatase/guanosine-5'-triphosphate,3'-diphosphate pyrophosphatase